MTQQSIFGYISEKNKNTNLKRYIHPPKNNNNNNFKYLETFNIDG